MSNEPNNAANDTATEQAIDLASLDPSRDSLRWERMIRSVATRGQQRRSNRLAREVVRRAIPAIVLAAAAATLVWLHAPRLDAASTTTSETVVATPSDTIADWAMDRAPTAQEVLSALVVIDSSTAEMEANHVAH